MRTFALVLALSAALTGCSTTTLEPKLGEKPLIGFDLVDPSMVDPVKFEADYAQCVQLANQDVTDVSRVAANALNSAAEKASLGVLGGKASKHADRQTVLKRCLSGRGYSVLR